MSNEAASLVMSIDSSGVQTAVVDLDKLTATAEKAEAATNRITQASAKSSAGYSGLTQATAAVSVSAEKYIKTMQAELDMLGRTRSEIERYNAASNKLNSADLAQVEAIAKKIDAYHREEQVMKDVAGAQDKAAAAADKFIAQLKYETETASLTTKELAAYKAAKLGVSDAAAPLIAAMKEGGHAMDGFSLSSSVAKRELLVMTRELGRGDFTKLGSSFSIFAQSSGLMAMAMSPLGLAISAVAATAGLAAVAFYEGSKESHAFTEAIINTGNYAGVTKGQLTDMSTAVAKTVGSQHEAADALAQLGATGRISGTDMAAFAVTAVHAAESSGVAIKDTVAEFVKLGQDPVKESARLNESMHYLTGAVFEQINSLVALGKTDEAATLAQKTYADAVDDRAKQIKTSLGYLETGWHSIGRAASNAWSAMMGVGRDLSISDQIAKLQGQIVTGQAGSKTGSIFDKGPTGVGSFNDDQNKKIQEQIALLQSTQRETQKLASLDGERAKIQEKSIDGQKLIATALEGTASKTEKMNKELDSTKRAFDAIRAADPTSPLLQKESGLLDAIQVKYAEKATAQKKGSDAYGTMLASIAKANEVALLELSTDEKMTAADRFRIQTLSQIDEMLRKKNITVAQSIDLKQKESAAEANMAAVLAAAEAKKATEALTKAHEQYIGVLENNLNTTQADTNKLRQQTAELGLSKEAIQGLRAAEMDRQATATDGLAIDALVNQRSVDAYNLLVQTAAAIRAKSAATRDFGAAETATDQAKKIKDNDVKLLESVDKAAESAFINIAENGSNAFTKIGKTLQTAVLDLLYQLTIKKFIFNVVPAFAGVGSGAAQAGGVATGGSDLLSGASTLGSLGSGVGLLGAGGLGLQAGFGALMTGGFAGVSAAVSGGLAAIGVGTGAGIAAGLGTIAGALGPIALAGFGIYSLFNKDSKPTSSTGDSQIRFDAAGNETSRLDLNTAAFKALASSSADAIVKGVQASYASAAAALGIAANASAFAYSGNTGKGGEKPQFNVSGGAGSGYYSSGEVATSDAAMQLEMSRVLFASLQGSDLPKYLKGAFDGMAAGAMSVEQINNVIKGAQELKVFHDQLKALPFANLADLSYQATAALIAASGGLQNLQANLGAYYKDFYTAEEQRANTIKQINATTAGSGLDAATATRDSFRKIVESQDLTTTSGQKMYAALLTVAGAFAGITPVSQDAAAALTKISDAMKRLQADTATLQVELMRAQGNTTGANKAQYTIDTAGLNDAERAVFDYNAGIRAQINALTAAKSATDALTVANKAATDSAFAALQRAIAAEKSRLTVIRDMDAEFVRSIGSVFDLLKTQISELYKSVDSSRAMQAAQGNAFIDNALKTAQTTGYLPSAKDLASAIAAARTGLDSTQFASRFEADKAALVMAGKLSELQMISGNQLTTAEKALQADNEQLTKLDETLALYQQQIDAINGVNTSVISVEAAIAALTAALTLQKVIKQASAASAADTYVASLPSDKTFNAAAANPLSARDQQVQAIYSSVLGRTADAGGLADFSNSSLTISQITASIQASAEASARAISVDYQNAFNSRVNTDLGLTSTIKAFAGGGDHMGGLRIVGENGPELESTGPSRIFTANQTRSMLSGDNTEMVKELRALRQEVTQLRASQDRGNEYGKIAADRLDGRQGQPFLVQVAS